ncbi:MAG: hypothetical protein ACI9R3_000935 [Verrucomicrobiales bacterium]|jgi:hypothetical protein
MTGSSLRSRGSLRSRVGSRCALSNRFHRRQNQISIQTTETLQRPVSKSILLDLDSSPYGNSFELSQLRFSQLTSKVSSNNQPVSNGSSKRDGHPEPIGNGEFSSAKISKNAEVKRFRHPACCGHRASETQIPTLRRYQGQLHVPTSSTVYTEVRQNSYRKSKDKNIYPTVNFTSRTVFSPNLARTFVRISRLNSCSSR